MPYHILARLKIFSTLLYELHDKRDTNSSMNQPPNYQEIGSFSLFAYLHTYKNLLYSEN